MSKPCSQLNSKVIRDKAECHIIAAIEKKCSVVAFKCVWRVHDDEIERAWSWICEKRDECDLTLSKLSEVCFYFSAISTSKLDSKKKTSKRSLDEARESDDSNEESTINPSQITSQGKQIFPAISYWLACQTQNGSAVNPFKIQRALVKCGLEFYLSRASRKKNSHDLNQLCQVLKDHKNPCLMNFVEASYQHCLKALEEEIEVSDDEHSQQLSATENVVRVRVLHDEFKPTMAASIQELRRAGLKIDCFGLHENADRTSSVALPCTPNKPLSCPITVLCNDIHAAMKKLHFGVYRGDVYKKVAETQFTFKFLCSMKTFLLNLMGNESFKDRLVQHFQRVLPLLSEPESCLIGQLKIDRNLVEVQDGWLWSFSAGSFVQGVIPESEQGLTSPRAYVPYNSLADPDPKYFKQILENSLPEEQIKLFCSDFLALFRQKEHKQPVPCAVGASDSGKTSLFSPVFQIVPLSRIARVTKQKSFNKSMIDSSTEVIFLDEAYSNLLDIDDWKIICQGGFTSHDVKWKKAQGFHCRASMYITCQQEMDFGEEHNDAMNRRLNKYFFKSLPHVEPEANQWLREHAMDCIVWAQKMATTCSSTTLTAKVSEEGGLASEDIQQILSVSIAEENLPSCSWPESSTESEPQNTEIASDSEGGSTDDNTDEGDLSKLRRELEKATPDGIRHRQLSMLLKNAETQRAATRTLRDYRLAGRRRFLVNLGAASESQASRLVTDPDDPLPTDLERKKEKALEERRVVRAAQQQHENEDKAKQVYSHRWLLDMEKEMSEHSKRLEQTTDSEEQAVLHSLLEINSNKLRLFHQGKGTLGLQEAVKERKKICLERGLVEQACVDCIRDVFSPLPVIVEFASGSIDDNSTLHQPSVSLMFTPPRSENGADDDNDEEDDQELYITPKPKTPSYIPSFDIPCPPSPLPLARTPRKRPRLSQIPSSRGQKKISSFFLSQGLPRN